MLRKLNLFVIVCCVLVVLSSCVTEKNEYSFEQDTRIGEVNISQMNEKEARRALEKHYDEVINQICIKVTSDSGEKTLSASDCGVSFDSSKALDLAKSGVNDISEAFCIDESNLLKKVNELSSPYTIEGTQAEYKYVGKGQFSGSDGIKAKELDKEALYVSVKEALLNAFLNADKRTTDIKVKIKDVDLPDGTQEQELSDLKQNYALIAEYTTAFDHAPLNATNRVKNIIKASEMLDGCVVKPNEKLNLNDVLGDRNKKNGWHKAPGIRNGTYVIGYGGGVCQVSSTLYNAVLLANLKVIERTPHSWPMSYVPAGQDATISTGGPNFIFENTGKSELIVAAIIDEQAQSLTIKLFGKAVTDYAHIEIVSKKVGTIDPPKPAYITEEDLHSGAEQIQRKQRRGVKTITERVFYDQTGKEIKRETVTHDTYRAIGAIIVTN